MGIRDDLPHLSAFDGNLWMAFDDVSVPSMVVEDYRPPQRVDKLLVSHPRRKVPMAGNVNMMRRVSLYCSLFLGLLITSAIFAGGESDNSVVVERSPMVSTTRSYDPQAPDGRMPATLPDEAGVTVSNFKCVAVLQGSVVHHAMQGTDVVAEVRVESAEIKLSLDVAEWISVDGGKKILAHEDGHRLIAEHFYDRADESARQIARQLIGTTVTGSGPDSDEAAKNALDIASAHLVRDYMVEVRDKSDRVQQAYDEITQHGTNQVDEMMAIEEALATLDAPVPVPASATRPGP
jgi:hypothetical protein